MAAPNALTITDVEQIRRAWAAGGVQQRQLAARYGVTGTTISHAVRGVTWPDAPGPIVAAGFRSGVPHRTRLPAVVGPCSVCGRMMVRARDYREDRAGWRAQGCVAAAGRGQCRACLSREARRIVRARPRLPAPLPPHEVARLRAQVGLPAVLPARRAS